MGAPFGNKNAARPRIFRNNLIHQLAQYERKDVIKGDALACIMRKLIELCLDGDLPAIVEVARRLDGTPPQAVTLQGDEEGGPVRITEVILRVVDAIDHRPSTESERSIIN